MNATRRQKPSISQDDIDRLLFYLEDARDYVIRYGSAQAFHSDEKATAERVIYAVDELALQITGRTTYFWAPPVSATGNEVQRQKALEKQAKRRRLLGAHIPVTALKIRLAP